MSRCQHCKKLTHSEDVYVTYDKKDHEKIIELRCAENWQCPWQYIGDLPGEIGRLKVGDIYIHFVSQLAPKE